MRLNNYSQLPVTNNGTRGLCGYISWETIGAAVADGVSSGVVKDYKKENVKEIGLDYPLLDAIKIVYENDFVVVLGGNKSPYGTIQGKGIGEQMEGKWMRMRGVCGMLRWFAFGCKEQKVWISAEVPLPNH